MLVATSLLQLADRYAAKKVLYGGGHGSVGEEIGSGMVKGALIRTATYTIVALRGAPLVNLSPSHLKIIDGTKKARLL